MSDRCSRCRRKLEDHGVIIVDGRHKYDICPTDEGNAVSEIVTEDGMIDDL